MPATLSKTSTTCALATHDLTPNPFSISIYGDPAAEIDDLLESVRKNGVLVPLVVVRKSAGWQVVSGHRRLACALALGMESVPAEVRSFTSAAAISRAILEYNRQRTKTFSQRMREADALEDLYSTEARSRRQANLRQFQEDVTDCRNSDDRAGRTDETIGRELGIGGKDLYRQARAIWQLACADDPRALSGVAQLDARTKTVHAAYKDLRRRDRFSAGFRPTPYDVWSFKHDRAFGVPHPGSIPPSIIAHTLHYFSSPGSLVVDPMAGGGTTLDVCASMGRHCLAYDLHPVRADIQSLDIDRGFPTEAIGCELIFCDPPYHTMLARRYASDGVASVPFTSWIEFLNRLAKNAFQTLAPGGYLALLLANQTEKDLPAGYGYLDHAFFGFSTLMAAGFLPQRRVSCPMDGAYLPQQVRQARADGRLLGQVRDLLIMRKPAVDNPLRQGIATSQLVDFAAYEGVREGRVAPDDRFGK